VKLMDMAMNDLLDQIASVTPAPGGGSVAALNGALAASLLAMACRITLGKKSLEPAWPLMRGACEGALALGARFRLLVDRDSEAYLAVAAAYALPKGTEAEKEARDARIQEGLTLAALVPQETLSCARDLVGIGIAVAESTAPGCITDVGTAAAALRAAAVGASDNVRINLLSLKDRSRRAALEEAAAVSLARTREGADRMEAIVESHLIDGRGA
jgi:methenyltetrahydrofolate cyclohydrolase